MNGVLWTNEELDYLKANHETKNDKELAEALGRTAATVRNRKTLLGLKKAWPKLGDRFNRLTLTTDRYLVWSQPVLQNIGVVRARCDCGDEREYQLCNVMNGHTKSCGCLSREKASARMKEANEQSDGYFGQQFGRLTVASDKRLVSVGRFHCYQVDCICECGKTATVLLHNIRNGRTKSCGCLRDEKAGDRNRTHGMSLTPLYRRWAV